MVKTNQNQQELDAQVSEILEILMSFGELDFENKIRLNGNSDQLDAIAAGINMLGEELKAKISKNNEKKIMLREIHHRVKNNLQIVSSILNLQAGVIQDPEVVAKFIDCKERIASMALVHEQLYQSENLSELEVNTYFAALCQQLEFFHAKSTISIEFSSAGKSIYLPMEKVIPLGLLANELIMNSYKHSFVNREQGQIRLQLCLNENIFTLELSDNGIGFENRYQFSNSTSLGLQLVHSLVDQLDADLVFSPNDPYCVTIGLKF